MEVFKIVPIILLMVGVILIYDARPIAKRRFSFGDQNEAAIRIKNNRIYFKYYSWFINNIIIEEVFYEKRRIVRNSKKICNRG